MAPFVASTDVTGLESRLLKTGCTVLVSNAGHLLHLSTAEGREKTRVKVLAPCWAVSQSTLQRARVDSRASPDPGFADMAGVGLQCLLQCVATVVMVWKFSILLGYPFD